jgi:hypothetical protein
MHPSILLSSGFLEIRWEHSIGMSGPEFPPNSKWEQMARGNRVWGYRSFFPTSLCTKVIHLKLHICFAVHLFLPFLIPTFPSLFIMSPKGLRVRLFVPDFFQECLFVPPKLVYKVYGTIFQTFSLHQARSLSLYSYAKSLSCLDAPNSTALWGVNSWTELFPSRENSN